MKIIVTYASAGAGHRKAAEAIYDYFKKQDPALNIQLVDVLDKTNRFYKYIYVHGYSFLVKRMTWLWGFLFWLTSFRPLRKTASFITTSLDLINARPFAAFLLKEKPDVIISTHFMPPEIVTHLKKNNAFRTRLITVLTDFGAHPFWLSEGTDQYVVASSFTKRHLLEEGIEEGAIKVFGIPIDEKFLSEYNKKSIRNKLGLLPDGFTVLMTTGSFGIGPIEKTVALLHNEAQIIVVCAHNRTLFRKLKNAHFSNVLVYPFVENIYELMAASDVVVAKPGGLTTSEILGMELLPIFINPIPGQETKNLKAMESYHIGKFVKRPEEIVTAILEYKQHPEKAAKIKQIIKEIKKPSAVKELYYAVCTGNTRPSG